MFIRLILLFIIFMPIYVLSTYSNYEDTTITLMAFIVSLGFFNLALILVKDTIVLHALALGYTKLVSLVGILSECLRLFIIYIYCSSFASSYYIAPIIASLVCVLFAILSFYFILPSLRSIQKVTIPRRFSLQSFLKPPSQAFSAFAILGFLNNQVERILMPVIFPVSSIAIIDNAQKVSLNVKSIVGQLSPTLTKFFLSNDNKKNPFPALIIYSLCTLFVGSSFRFAEIIYDLLFSYSAFTNKAIMTNLITLSLILLSSQIAALFSYRTLLFNHESKRGLIRSEAVLVVFNLFCSTFIASIYGIKYILVGSIISTVGILVYSSVICYYNHKSSSLLAASTAFSLIAIWVTLVTLL